MAVKILLADKSITIQKVVEMLFSGREYEVICASDGETALNEAARVVPDVVLADVDLPRVDGYSFAARLRRNPTFAQTPVILMLSRDDVFDSARAKQSGIIDNIAKPFESQELIGKVKKAIYAAPPRLKEPAPAAAAPKPAASPPPSPRPAPAAAAKPTVPSDIFDIIKEAPTPADVKKAAAPPDESVYEVEPVVEIEEPLAAEAEKALPVGEKAVQEIREGLGLGGKPSPGTPPETVSFETLGMEIGPAREYVPPPPIEKRAPRPITAKEPELKAPQRAKPEAPPFSAAAFPPTAPQAVSEDMVREMLRSVAQEAVEKIVRDVMEKVAWEVIPDLAEMLIKAEIERLKAEG